MSDELVSALLPEGNLRVILATTTGLSREGRDRHEASPVAGDLLARSLTAGLLLASLQKESTRINLQLTCDGPLRGIFVDADSDGRVRGYVNNPRVDVSGAPGPFRWRPAMGNSGQFSVLRDLGKGEYYRSSIELEAFDPAGDLQRYFAVSEQLPTEVWLDVVPSGDEPLGRVAGLLIQPLPDANPDFFQTWTWRLREHGGFSEILAAGAEKDARSLLAELFDITRVEPMSQRPLSWHCRCSREGVLDAVRVMGEAELEDVLRTDKRVEATCHFCNTRYVIEEPELQALLTGARA